MLNFVNCDILGHLMVFRDGFLIVTAFVILAEWVQRVGIDGGHDFHHDGGHDGGHDKHETIVLCDPLVWLPLLPKMWMYLRVGPRWPPIPSRWEHGQ